MEASRAIARGICRMRLEPARPQPQLSSMQFAVFFVTRMEKKILTARVFDHLAEEHEDALVTRAAML